MSPVRALRGKRGFMVSMLVWAILIAAGLLGGGYMIAQGTGEAQTDVDAVERIAQQNADLIRENEQRIRDVTELAHKIQVERLRTAAINCQRDSNQNRQIIAFLRVRNLEPEALAQARRYFPVLSDRECARQARGRVSTP